MVKKDMLLIAVLLSGIVQADCPDYSSCCPKKYDSCSQECNLAVEDDAPCGYRMCATLYMDDVQLDQKMGPVKGGPVMFEDYSVQVSIVEEREDGVVVQVTITNRECPQSRSCKDECRILPVEDDTSDESCDSCLKHVPWGQEVVVSCANCKYSMRIAVEKSE